MIDCLTKEYKGEGTVNHSKCRSLNVDLQNIKSSNHIYFSSWECEALQQAAISFTRSTRVQPCDRSDPTQDCLFLTIQPDIYSKEDYAGEVILTELLQKGISPMGSSRNRDLQCMSKYLKKNVEAGLPILPETNLRNFMLGGVPLIQHLFTDSDTLNSDWLYPSKPHLEQINANASIDNSTWKKVSIWEITIGVTPQEEIEQFAKWTYANHKVDQDKFPSGLISLDVEEIKIHKTGFKDLKDAVATWTKDTPLLTVPIPGFWDKDCTNIPAKIIYGNGDTWMASIRFNWNLGSSNGRRCYQLDPTPIPENSTVFRSLLKLDYYTGQGIMSDRNGLQDFIRTVYKLKIGLPRVIEIDALSRTAGYRLKHSGMFITNLVTMGGLLNKEVSCADGMWCLPIEDLDPAFVTYLIGDVRFGYNVSIAYLSIILRNVFPDPYVLCSTLELNQRQAVGWFCTLVFNCISELGFDTRSPDSTRQDLIRALHGYTDTYPREQYRDPYPETEIFAKLIPDWPNVPFGGPRYLSHVLAFFVTQYRTLQELVQCNPDLEFIASANLHHVVDEAFIKRVTFGRGEQRDLIIPGSKQAGLRSLSPTKLFQVNTLAMTNSDINDEAQRSGQYREQGILEVMRINAKVRFTMFNALKSTQLGRS
jgi:hypothetical protein